MRYDLWEGGEQAGAQCIFQAEGTAYAKALKNLKSEETKRRSLADDQWKDVSRGMRLEEKVEQYHVGPGGYCYEFDLF